MSVIEKQTTFREVDILIKSLIQNLVNIKDNTGQFLLKLPDGKVVDTKGWITGWEWTHGIGLYGMWHYFKMNNKPEVMSLICEWYSSLVIGKDDSNLKNVNTMSVFLTMANVYEFNGNKKYLPYLETWGEWAMYELKRTKCGAIQHVTYLTDNHGQMWDDSLMMTVMPLAKIGKLLNREHYIEESKKQMLLHIKYLTDTKTGLWFHGFTFDGNHHFAGALWARGNSWITIVIPEFIELLELDSGNALREVLIEALNSQVETLTRLQNDSGMWHTLLDDPTSYTESSATAGFAYGILKAVRMGYIDPKFRAVGVKAINAVMKNIDYKGELINTSFGTGMGDTLQFYKDIPLTSMPYGQAMAIMALVEFSKSIL
ncbi:hypothetical protein G9P44_006290 [Scheffersomyces stipitis]|nr:hypothetical protein G9P44_006290 [Scheffersomyces stipitis]